MKKISDLIPGSKEFTPEMMEKLKEEQVKNLKDYNKKMLLKPIKKTLKAEEMYAQFPDAYIKTQVLSGKKIAYSFTKNEGKEDLIKNLCLYFTNDKRFEERNPKLKLHKGIFLYGSFGTAKTSIMMTFKNLVDEKFLKISLDEVATGYATGGHDQIKRYMSCTRRLQREYGWLFDDVGEETAVKHFGDTVEVFEKIIISHYRQENGGKIHATSNLGPEQIEDRYIKRASSRMNEMFNFMHIGTHEDFRNNL